MKWFYKALFLAPALLSAYEPWLTGPLLTPARQVIPFENLLYQPYNVVRVTNKAYDSEWNLVDIPSRLDVETIHFLSYGIAPRVDFQLVPSIVYRNQSGAESVQFGDLPIGAQFQLVPLDRLDPYLPALLINVTEFLPTAQYQYLQPSKKGADALGRGSYVTAVGITASHIFSLFGGENYLVPRFNISAEFPAPTHVREFNSYGGGSGTDGTVYPGFGYFAYASAEYTFNQNWVFTLDLAYTHRNRTRFSGCPGFNSDGTEAVVGGPSSESFRVAPGIEYNVTQNFGFLLGGIYVFAGRNTNQSAAGVLTIVAFF